MKRRHAIVNGGNAVFAYVEYSDVAIKAIKMIELGFAKQNVVDSR